MSLPPFSGSEQRILWPSTDYFTVFYDNQCVLSGKGIFGRPYSTKDNLHNRFYQAEIYQEKNRFDNNNIFLKNTGSLGFHTGKVYYKIFQRTSSKWLDIVEYPRELNKLQHESIICKLYSSFIKVDEEQKKTSRDYAIYYPYDE